MKRYVLVDCNNFFASCERVFNPKLVNKPVVVLSSNDGCIIARSNEAKALGIGMGAPLFEVADIVKKHNVYVLSSNFALYGDMSARVMHMLASLSTDIEIYSVDEAFLFIPEYIPAFNVYHSNNMYYTHYCAHMRAKVKLATGIPTSIGIGSTKTLAKIANRIAKKNPHYNGVFDSTHQDMDEILRTIDVGDIWGIGYRYAKLLKSYGFYTAYDFKYACEKWVRKKMTVVGLKTLLEIRGQPCIKLEDMPSTKKSICVSRSFGKNVTTLHELKEALSTYVQMASEKVRIQKSVVVSFAIFVTSSRFCQDGSYYNSIAYQMATPTSYSPLLVQAALTCLEKIFKPGIVYKKVGIIFTQLVSSHAIQMSTYEPLGNLDAQAKLMKTVDRANAKWGRDMLFFASAGISRPWKMKQLKKSQNFTTNWNEILTVHT